MKNKIIFFLFVLFSFSSKGTNIIRDSEIEETVKIIAQPLFEASGQREIKIYLIQDDDLNAFTPGGAEIYINSGMITRFSDIDVLRGVIAHEIGHILGKHSLRMQENIDTYSKAALSTIAIGLAGTALSKSSGSALPAIMLGGLHFSQRSILSHSRAFESSADQAAIKLLEKAKYSSLGMIKFFEYMARQHNTMLINPYDQTHPLSNDRLITLKSSLIKSKYKDAKNSADLEYKFSRSAAKLTAFTADPKKLLKSIQPNLNEEIINYIKAICYFRMGDLNKSKEYIDKLISLRPNDAFYHELKGQILFEFGNEKSLESYTKALKLKPNDLLIKLSRAIVGITIFSSQPNKIQQFYQDLKLVSEKEPQNILPLYYMAIYYEKLGLINESRLNTALIAYKNGELELAKKLAKIAIKGLKQGTPDWYKANDIILTEK